MISLLALLTFSISMVAIVIIIYRKVGYLKKLAPSVLGLAKVSSNQRRISFFARLFPEVAGRVSQDELDKRKSKIAIEWVKLLGKLRLILLRLEKQIFALTGYLKERFKSTSSTSSVPTEKLELANLDALQSLPERIKRREQELIMEIARSPKNAKLYLELGRAYFELEEFSDARQSFETALELEPENELAIEWLSRIKRTESHFESN